MLSQAVGADEGRVFADWKKSAAGSPPLEQQQDLSIQWKSPALATVLDDSTDPASPFPENGKAISVTKVEGVEGKPRFSLKVQAFAAPAKEGWIETELFLRGGGGIRLIFQTGGTLAISGPTEEEDRGEGLLTANLRTEESSYITLAGKNGNNAFFAESMTAEIPFVFRATWWTSGDQVTFSFEKDGQVVVSRAGEPIQYTVTSSSEPCGVDFLTITGTDFAIGKISTSKE